MNNKSVWKRIGVGGAMGIMVVGGALWWSHKTTSPSVVSYETQSGIATVHITEEGFTPSELKVTAGTVVRFVNDDQYWHWPASDPHPTHTFYSEIDPREPVAPDTSWEVTVSKPGTWGLHDHLAPYIIGTLTVVE